MRSQAILEEANGAREQQCRIWAGAASSTASRYQYQSVGRGSRRRCSRRPGAAAIRRAWQGDESAARQPACNGRGSKKCASDVIARPIAHGFTFARQRAAVRCLSARHESGTQGAPHLLGRALIRPCPRGCRAAEKSALCRTCRRLLLLLLQPTRNLVAAEHDCLSRASSRGRAQVSYSTARLIESVDAR